MKNIFKPDYYVTSIYNISFGKLREMGIRNALIDIDNTLMPWGSERADDRVRDLVRELKEEGIRPCILSNAPKNRVKTFVENLDIDFYSSGRKPMKMTFLGALKKLGAKPKNTCIIGDQIFTDILGGNRIGLYSILVDPIDKNESLHTQWIRAIERIIKKKLNYAKELMKGE
ncbi:YqeG family HAD IIIA-type phosphatase [Fonticella tunisiensis]|uniref:YqeG family HAD IIIA-type phosphatase n=1 Tax=Fonticella tunisiensis TaxID=1096341 RepID=A0A4R7KRJ3_9CLOT|nr:YqeG family HAD IIIA-type phosphatase [Fonticella tunisiensis]TDT61973.1 hypothetical protein EDD71_105153 [Fonticella tunisiensis]